MNKRIISILLVFILLFGSVASFAEKGDYIHTGLKKKYSSKSEKDIEELTKDIIENSGTTEFMKQFYREVENGKYVNVVDEEEKQMEILEDIIKQENLTTAEEIQEYLTNEKNADEIKKIIDKKLNEDENLKKEFKDIPDKDKGEIEDYNSASSAPLLTEKNYSTPEPGLKEGTTKISTLNLPNNASKWMIQVLDNEVQSMDKDTTLQNGTSYIKGKDIEVETGKYLVLYAVDSSNKIKAYVNIRITEEMVKKPKEQATKLEVGKIEEGKKYAGAVIISKLGKLPKDATRWQVVVNNQPVDKVYKDEKISDAVDYVAGNEIVIANEYELENMDSNFKKYTLLLATDEDGKVKGYTTFEIDKDHISKAPTKLEESTNFKGPIPGNDEETTRFEYIGKGLSPDEYIEQVTKWQVKIYDEKPYIPALDSKIDEANYTFDKETINKDDEDNKDIKINPGQYLMLLGTDNENKIKGYRIFKIREDEVKGKTASLLSEKNYSEPEKGSKSGTTKINTLNFDGIDGKPTKWMYVVGDELQPPMLDKKIAESVEYVAGNDIKISAGNKLMILATANDGKVKAYKIFDTVEIKDPPPMELKEGVHYSKPIKGTEVGTTRFENLAFTPSLEKMGAAKWGYKVSDKPFDVPELDSVIDEIETFEAKANIGKNLKGNEYLLLLATDEDGQTKGYAILQLNEEQVKMPDATEITDEKFESLKIVPGTTSGTTKVEGLSVLGLSEEVTQWMYKVQSEKFETPELNSTMDRAIFYTSKNSSSGPNISASIGDNLILLATDSRGKIKAYKTFEITENDIKAPNAKLLLPTTNYSEPEPGTEENSTKFSFLSFAGIDGATKWMYKINDKPVGSVELDSVAKKDDGYKEYTKTGSDITPAKDGQYLLLVATDENRKVKAYREFRLTINNIRGSKAPTLDNGNYKIEPGTLPGTSKLVNLGFWGVEGANRWKVKVMDKDLNADNIPYINSIVSDAYFYNEGQNIQVLESQWILLLAVDNGGRTKAYTSIEVKENNVKKYAPEIEGVELAEGSAIDTVKITGTIPEDTKAKVIVQNTKYPTPSLDQVLMDGKDYELNEDIVVVAGQHITLFAVDNDNKIKGFKSFELTGKNSKKIKKATATIEVKTSDKNIIPEGGIVIGGEKIEITLTDAKWANDIKTNEIKRNALYNGFKPSNQSTEWSKVVAALINDGSGAIFVSENSTTLTMLLPEVPKYNISQKQEVTLTIPANCIEGAISSVQATEKLEILPTVKATISGDVVSSTVREKDIKIGGKTIVIELEDGSWIGNIADNADTLFGEFKVVSEVGEDTDTQWSKVVNALTESTNPKTIVRNSSKKITITLPKVDIDLGTNYETIKLEIPKDLIEGATSNVVAIPTFTIHPNIMQVKGEAVEENNTITMIAPDNKEVKEDKNTWIINVTNGTLKEEITANDLIIAGLPRGLKADIEKVEGENKISISISGRASSSINTKQTVKIRIKGNAVTELNTIDSNDINVYIEQGTAKDLSGVDYSLKSEGNDLFLYLINVDEEMQYSLNSTDGINGDWEDIALGKDNTDMKIDKAKPMRIFVREKAQPKVFREVVNLKYEEAPKDVSIEKVEYIKQKDGEKIYEKVKLNGIDNTMEYSIDGEKTWTSIDDNYEISLDENSDLRVRKKAVAGEEGGKLHSLSTAKLNGEFLGNVTMNVGEEKIKGTTTNMEYSLDSTNGVDGSFAGAKNNETPIKFVNNAKIYIREKGAPINARELGTVEQQEELTDDEMKNIGFDIKAGTITNNNNEPDYTLQYRIEDDPWKDVKSDEQVNFKPGSLQFRKKGTETKLPSAPEEKTVIQSPSSPPELKIDDFNKGIKYVDNNGKWKEIDDKLEYKIGNAQAWSLGSKWSTDKNNIKFENVIVYVRTAATTNELPSQAKAINFTKNLNLEEVKVNVVEGYIENTTTNMEYSTNSTDGKNGTWNSCSNGKTKVELVEGMSVWIREKDKIENNNNGDPILQEVERQPKPDLDTSGKKVDFDISLKTISNKSEQDLEYRIGNEAWKKLDRNSDIYEVDFKPGKLQFRKRGTFEKLPSFPVDKATIKSPASAPELSYDDTAYTIEKIGSSDGDNYEYSINDSPWIAGTINTEFTGNDTVKVRIKADKGTLPSQEQIIKFTPNLVLYDVKLDAGKGVLIDTNDRMEYSIDHTDENDGTWFKCTSPNTKVALKKNAKVYIREAKKPRNIRPVNEKDIGKQSLLDKDVITKISYNILEKTISINTSINTNENIDSLQKIIDSLQYRNGMENWTNIGHMKLEPNKKIILAYNVDFQPGKLEFRLKGDANTLPSDIITKDIIKAAESKPTVEKKLIVENPEDNYNPKNTIDTINGSNDNLNNFEYTFDKNNGPWINAENLKNEDLNKEITIFIRKKATENALASQIEEVNFDEVLNLKIVNLSTHTTPYELNGTTERMEYAVKLKGEGETEVKWFRCDKGNTTISDKIGNDDIAEIWIRDKEQQENELKIYSKDN